MRVRVPPRPPFIMRFPGIYAVGMILAVFLGIIIGVVEERTRIEEDCMYTNYFRAQGRVYFCNEDYSRATVIPDTRKQRKKE